MKRGTTPTIQITLTNIDVSSFDCIYLTLAQHHKELISKDKSQMEINGNVISVKLTQEDTLKLDVGIAKIQVRLAKESGKIAIASEIVDVYVDSILKEGVIE